jgi:hypothetical protein
MNERCSTQRTNRRSSGDGVRGVKARRIARRQLSSRVADARPREVDRIEPPPDVLPELLSCEPVTSCEPVIPAEPEKCAEPTGATPDQKVSSIKNRASLGLVLTFFFGAILLTVLSLFLCPDQYSVETRLLLTMNPTGKSASQWPESEIRLLSAPPITSAMETQLFKEVAASGQMTITPCADPAIFANGVPPEKRQECHSPDWGMAFRQWFACNLSVNSDIQGQTAWVTLTLNGDDPQFMKRLLGSYVLRYADYRRKVLHDMSESLQRVSETCESEPQSREAEALASELQKMDLYERNCSLALNLLQDSASGVFSGFVPESGVTGIPVLGRFQEKIIQLELTKKELLGKFTPQSREIREIQSQIRGVRASMRECLEAHLKFIKMGKEQLIAQKAEMERKKGPVRSAGNAHAKPCSETNTESGELLKLQDGLQVLWDGSFVIKKRLLLSPSEAKKAVLEVFDSRFLNATVERSVKGPDWRQVAASFGKHNSDRSNQAAANWPTMADLDPVKNWLIKHLSNATSDLSDSSSQRGRVKASGDN